MTKKKSIALQLVVLAGASALPTVAGAQAADQKGNHDGDHANHSTIVAPALVGANLILRVDGMSCPFCAFGLERKLGEITGIDTVVVVLSDGLVAIRHIEGVEIDDRLLRETVSNAGFSLREVTRPGGD